MDGLDTSVSLGQWLAAEAAGTPSSTAASHGFLTQVFSYLIYPALVLAVLLVIFLVIRRLIYGTQDTYERARRFAAALLPLISLSFVRVTHPSSDALVSSSISKPLFALVGGLVGLLLIELGRFLIRSDAYLAIPIYTFSLSALATFMTDSILGSGFHRLDFFIFTLVIAVALDIVVRGLPKRSADSRAHPNSQAMPRRSSTDPTGATLT